MQESQNQVTYQASITWYLGKGIQKKKTPESQPQRSSTLESSSACSTRTTLTSRRRLLLQSTSQHQWLGQQSSPPSLPSGNEDDQQKDVLQNASSETTKKRRQGGIRVSAVLRARNRRVAGDLSPWREERCRGACMVVAMAVRLLKNCIAPYSDQVPYHPSPLSSKSLIIQVPPSNKSFLEQTPPLSTNLGFSFSVLSPGWKVFSLTIFTIYDLAVFLPVPLISWEVFYRLILCPVFLLSLPISGLGGFSPATWPLETHQLP